MINKPVIKAILWSLGLLALAACWTAGAAAMGAPTENYTITDLPNSSTGFQPIKPPVNFILEGPTSQTDNQTPAFIAGFESPDGGSSVKGNGNWYLDIDINGSRLALYLRILSSRITCRDSGSLINGNCLKAASGSWARSAPRITRWRGSTSTGYGFTAAGSGPPRRPAPWITWFRGPM